MLRTHFLQQCFKLSNVAVEEALFDLPLYLEFAGPGGVSRLPDRVSILKFCHLLEKGDLAPKTLDAFKTTLAAKGLVPMEGTAIDATLMAAPNSMKNGTGTRDSEMPQATKGNRWNFMKPRVDVDADYGLVDGVVGAAPNVNDVPPAHARVNGNVPEAFVDASYQGVERWKDTLDIKTERHVAMRPSKCWALDMSKPAAALID